MAADFPPPAVGISRGWGWGPLLPRTHLHKQGDGVKPEDLHAVHGIPGQDVQGPSAALHDLLHPHTVLHQKRQWGMVTGGPWTWPHTHTHTPHNAPTASLVREVDLLRLQLAPPYVLLCAYTFTQRTP